MQIKTQQDEIPASLAGVVGSEVPVPRRPEICARRGLIGLVIAAGIFNVMAMPVNRLSRESGDWVIRLVAPLIFGVLLGQVGAMACWLVWAEGSFPRRLAAHWSIALALVLSLLGGAICAMDHFNGDYMGLFTETLVPACMLPAVSLAVQLPLWPFRTHLSWRVAPMNDAATTNRSALSILDILIGTAIVAVSLGLIRYLSGIDRSLSGIGQSQYQNLIMMQTLASGLMLTVVSFVLLVPALILLLRSHSFGAGAGIYFGAVPLSITGLLVVPSALFGRLPPAEMLLTTCWGSIVFATAMASPLFVWRACGYRLVWARDQKRAE